MAVIKRRFAHKDHATNGRNAGWIWTFNENGLGCVLTCAKNKSEQRHDELGVGYAEQLVRDGLWIELEPLMPDAPSTQAGQDPW